MSNVRELVAKIRELPRYGPEYEIDTGVRMVQYKSAECIYLSDVEKLLQAPQVEQRNWKGVRWADSIRATSLAQEIALHFGHDCEDSMCDEDADASTCEMAWVEEKLMEFLDVLAVAPAEPPAVELEESDLDETNEQFVNRTGIVPAAPAVTVELS